MGKGNEEMVGGRYHSLTALWRDIRFSSEWHLRYSTLSEGKNNNNTTYGDLVRPMPSVLMAIDTGGVHWP